MTTAAPSSSAGERANRRLLDARLVKAVGAGDLAAAQAAVADGASVSVKGHGMEPLHVACDKGHLDIAQWLHSAGASLDATDNRECIPLHNACSRGHLGIAQWLHGAGASLNTTDCQGYTPLHFACWDGHLDIAQWLCSVGADATLKTNAGHTLAQLLQAERPGRAVQLDPQALRNTLACLVRRAQAQGPLPRPAAPV